MISHEEARRLLAERTPRLGAEEVPAALCAGRTLAEDVVARLASPPFDKSAMDGYAVRAEDVADLPAELTLVGASYAGSRPDFAVGPGQCAEIATGAPVPAGADAVVMVEHTARVGEDKVRVERLSGPNICKRGEDLDEGETVLRTGETLTAVGVGLAASAGYARLRVSRRPCVAILCTGTEVVEPGAEVPEGRIYNSNGPMMRALLGPLASRCEYLGIVGDEPAELGSALERGFESDLLIVTGGVSVGPYDLVPRKLTELGMETVFHNCAIKPGKPVLFGLRGKQCVFGLPGNPFSCFVMFHILLRTAIGRMQGAKRLPPRYGSAAVCEGFRNKGDRKTFRPCRVETAEGRAMARVVATSGSADIRRATAANALLVVPQGVKQVETGNILEYIEVGEW